MNLKKKKENKMYFISDSEYIYFPFSINFKNYKNNNIKIFRNQLICLNPRNEDVIYNE